MRETTALVHEYQNAPVKAGTLTRRTKRWVKTLFGQQLATFFNLCLIVDLTRNVILDRDFC